MPVPTVEVAVRHTVTATVAVFAQLVTQIDILEQELNAHFERHPDAEILLSQSGLGPVLAARVLAEFGDDPTATPTPKPAVTAPRTA